MFVSVLEKVATTSSKTDLEQGRSVATRNQNPEVKSSNPDQAKKSDPLEASRNAWSRSSLQTASSDPLRAAATQWISRGLKFQIFYFFQL